MSKGRRFTLIGIILGALALAIAPAHRAAYSAPLRDDLPTATDVATATSTLQPIDTPEPTPTGTPTSTSTATATPTATPTRTRTPAPLNIDKIMIAHVVKGKQQTTTSLHLNEQGIFAVLYHLSTRAGRPAATVALTKNGKPFGTYRLSATAYSGHSAFHTALIFRGSSTTGKFYAHFKVQAGSLTARRDRRFYVTR